MPIVRALACDASDYSVLEQAYDSINSCMVNVRFQGDTDLQDCLMSNKVSTSCSVCAANAAQSVSDCLITCDYEGPNCVKCLNTLRDDYDISGDPVVCGILKNLMPPSVVELFQNDRINEMYSKFNVSTELSTPPPALPVKATPSVEPKANADTPLPVKADDSVTTTTTRSSSLLPTMSPWTTAIFVLSVVLLNV